VNSGFEQLFHGDISQVTSSLDCILQLPAASPEGRRLATTTQSLLLQLPAPRDYIPVPAPLRNEQRVREDLSPGYDSSAAPPEPDSAETGRQTKTFLPKTKETTHVIPHTSRKEISAWGDASRRG